MVALVGGTPSMFVSPCSDWKVQGRAVVDPEN
jgi:hypothetical protein